MNELPTVTVATDGAALNNPHGPAGWGWFVNENCWAAGGFKKASNQAAEMFAVIAALRAVPRGYPVVVRTDSQFVINVATKWMRGWKKPDGTWAKADGSEPANLKLVKALDAALAGRKTQFVWVKGHSGDNMNEIADRICSAAANAVKNDQPVVSGPGWTGDSSSPKIALKGTRPEGQPAKKPASRPAAPVERVRLSGGEGANARVRRVTATTPSSPDRGKPVMCPSCDRPMNPITFECGCSG